MQYDDSRYESIWTMGNGEMHSGTSPERKKILGKEKVLESAVRPVPQRARKGNSMIQADRRRQVCKEAIHGKGKGRLPEKNGCGKKGGEGRVGVTGGGG